MLIKIFINLKRKKNYNMKCKNNGLKIKFK